MDPVLPIRAVAALAALGTLPELSPAEPDGLEQALESAVDLERPLHGLLDA